MILGIGIDTVYITRIDKLIQDFGDKFEQKIFTSNEIAKAQSFDSIEKKTSLKTFYAKRFAAKEALSKAIGLGIGRGVDFRDIEVDNDALGKPFIKILNEKEDFIKQHFKVDKMTIHLSLSDESDLAMAMVVIDYPPATVEV